MIERCP